MGLAALFFWMGRKPARSPEEAAEPVVAPVTIPAPAVPEPAREGPPDTPPKVMEPTLPGPGVEKPLLEFSLPTDNQSIYTSQPDQFFMFVDRYTP